MGDKLAVVAGATDEERGVLDSLVTDKASPTNEGVLRIGRGPGLPTR